LRVPTAELNRVIREALQAHQPTSHSGRLLKLRYVTQVAVDPPSFVFFVNDPEIVHFSYRRFLENQLREQFKLTGTALRLHFRSSREAPPDVAGKPRAEGLRSTGSQVPAQPGGKVRRDRGQPVTRPRAARRVTRSSSDN
jgi:hypothetical protein